MNVKKGISVLVRHKGELYLISSNSSSKRLITPLPPNKPFEVFASNTTDELHAVFASGRYKKLYNAKAKAVSSPKSKKKDDDETIGD